MLSGRMTTRVNDYSKECPLNVKSTAGKFLQVKKPTIYEVVGVAMSILQISASSEDHLSSDKCLIRWRWNVVNQSLKI